jgi:hypothetical protein
LVTGGRGEPKLGAVRGFDFYSSWMNPSSGLRGFGRRLLREPGGVAIRVAIRTLRAPMFSRSLRRWGFEKKDKNGQFILREHTKGIRLTVEGRTSEFITVLWPGSRPPEIESLKSGVWVGDDEITFAGGIDDEDQGVYVSVRRGGKPRMTLAGRDIDLDRAPGEVGLFVPDAGYPFGVIPNGLILSGPAATCLRAIPPRLASARFRRFAANRRGAVSPPRDACLSARSTYSPGRTDSDKSPTAP